MDIDIQTAHVRMQPEWHRMIDAWVERCRRKHPDLGGIDVMLRHDGQNAGGDAATVEATAGGRHLRGTSAAATMSTALYEALDAVENELLVREAVTRRV